MSRRLQRGRHSPRVSAVVLWLGRWRGVRLPGGPQKGWNKNKFTTIGTTKEHAGNYRTVTVVAFFLLPVRRLYLSTTYFMTVFPIKPRRQSTWVICQILIKPSQLGAECISDDARTTMTGCAGGSSEDLTWAGIYCLPLAQSVIVHICLNYEELECVCVCECAMVYARPLASVPCSCHKQINPSSHSGWHRMREKIASKWDHFTYWHRHHTSSSVTEKVP